MKSLKKLFIINAILLISSLSIGANFTLEGHQIGSEAKLTIAQVENNGSFTLNISAEKEKVAKNINSVIEKEINKIPKTDNIKYGVFPTANNSKYLSVVLVKETIENDTHTLTHKGMVFDAETGEKLEIDDILQSGFEDGLKNALNDRIAQFGLKKKDKFNGLNDLSSFYMEDDTIVFIFDKGVATDDNDGLLFVPFFLVSLQQIIK